MTTHGQDRLPGSVQPGHRRITLQRYWRSTRIPAAFAAAFGLYVTATYFLTDGEIVRQFGLSLGTVLAIYAASALGSGLVVTLFGHWATTRIRATLLGFLSGMVLAVVLNFTITPTLVGRPLSGFQLAFVMIAIGIFPGAFVAALFWEPPESPTG